MVCREMVPVVVRIVEAREQVAAIRSADWSGRRQVLPFAAEDVTQLLMNGRMVSVAAKADERRRGTRDRKNDTLCFKPFSLRSLPQIIQTQLVQTLFAPPSTVR